MSLSPAVDFRALIHNIFRGRLTTEAPASATAAAAAADAGRDR